MDKLYRVGQSPHIRTKETIESVMYDVVIALLPTLLVAIYFFGMKALYMTLVAVISAMLAEYVSLKLMKREITIFDGSAIITGMLFAFISPVTLPYPYIIIGSVVSIVIGKMVFGGLGHNVFNPALLGRVFLMASWPALLTRYVNVDGSAGATTLDYLKKGKDLMEVFGHNVYLDMFIGKMAGSMGETSALALLIGGLYLIYKKHIDWKMPVTIISAVFILALIFGQNPFYHILSGGLFIGAFFMATDMVTTPYTTSGKIIFGLGVACITMLIRLKGSYPEGVAFSILIMNGVTSLINKYTKPKKFGEVKSNE
ncbi:electron transport complex protein RnfD [Hypnocyclicus thermotrophus]|uniref:Ion-translocating oxidoreductase complex subunit D n=1 Tax=Hypnocyclicus thermotrophus TaxID=1627895 RepID=A0AA46I5J1_9FUSO|nr:RnfABCDGE type electron transport complex subunit D [Hypnocyclicus thermotrophus]TDT69870.1 electron transport complex protein RnfD [Hypnocyclicus thermotrophus]